ncbi:hypothetical protein [Castellaniella caeni]|uniref:hypothetical protein n=1 Tax=Castellaniella caeni TaxID=266123 RepID=UPI000C9F9FAA|nr:hypothetical protein [Castellaniella caeni]
MDKDKVEFFMQHYRSLSEWELFDLAQRKMGLVDEARTALAKVITEKGIDLEGLRGVQAQEETSLCEDEARKEKRSRRWTVVLWFVLPITIFVSSLILGDDRTSTLVVAALAKAVVVSVVFGVVSALIYKLRRK